MEEDSWHGGISDLMTGLMVIFLLIAISYMLMVERSNVDIKKAATEIIEQVRAVKKLLLPTVIYR